MSTKTPFCVQGFHPAGRLCMFQCLCTCLYVQGSKVCVWSVVSCVLIVGGATCFCLPAFVHEDVWKKMHQLTF